MSAPAPSLLLALRWRAWEAAARRIAGDDERLVRRWVALRWWYVSRPQNPHPA